METNESSAANSEANSDTPRTRRLFLGGAAAGVTATALSTATGIGAASASAAEGDAREVNGLGWHDVRGYGATGDGTTDDTLAIQAALDACEPGNTVYLPAGQYRTSAPVTIPPYVTLQGTHGGGENEWGAVDPAFGLKPLPTFDGDAVVLVLDKLTGGYATKSVEVRILQLTIDGSALPAGGAEVDGIRAVGQVQHLQLRDVQVRKVTGHGINTTYSAEPNGPQAPFCLHFDRVSVLWPGTFGIALNNCTDSVIHDVYVLGGNGAGWWIAGTGNSTFTSCRAEWSAKEGFILRTWQGIMQFSGCSTDRNGYDGVNVENTDGKGILQLSGWAHPRRPQRRYGRRRLRRTEGAQHQGQGSRRRPDRHGRERRRRFPGGLPGPRGVRRHLGLHRGHFGLPRRRGDRLARQRRQHGLPEGGHCRPVVTMAGNSRAHHRPV